MFQAMGPIDVEGEFTIDGWGVTAQQKVSLGTGSGSGNGRLSIRGGGVLTLNNGFEFLRDGDVSLGDSNMSARVANRGGSFLKTGGNGTSDVTVPFDDLNGTIGGSSGALRFTRLAALGGTTIDVEGTQVQFLDDTTISGGLIFRSSNLGELIFIGSQADVTLDGVLTNDPMASNQTGAVVFAGNTFSGGTIDLESATAFIHQSGRMGVNQQVVNQGAYQWQGGTITGQGLVNANPTEGEFLINANASKMIVNGTLTNQGHITQQSDINLGASGKIVNETEESVYVLDGATLNDGGSNTSTEFDNSGTLESRGSSLINARLTNTKTVSVTSGELRIAGPADIRGTVRVDHTTNPATFSLGTNNSSTSTLDGTQFQFVGDDNGVEGIAKWRAGQHDILGELTSDGVGEVQFNGGTLRVAENSSATLNLDDSAPFVVNANPNNSLIQVDGSLSNVGLIDWRLGTLGGAQALVNNSNAQRDGLIAVTGIATVSDGTGGELRNNGFIEIRSPSNSQGIVLNTGGRLVNELTGQIDFLGNGGIFLGVSAQSDSAEFVNSGILGKLDGNRSVVSAPFVQPPEGLIEVTSGELALIGDTELEGRVSVRRTAGNPKPSLVISGSSFTGDLQIAFDGGSGIETIFSNDNDNVVYTGNDSRFEGVIRGTGRNGELRLDSANLQVDDHVTFNVTGENVRVRHRGRMRVPEM